MEFGLKFGLLKPSGSGTPTPVYSNTRIAYDDVPGTYDFVILPNGFELELYGDGDATTNPTVILETDEIIPSGSSIEFTITIETLSGVNILAYTFINFFSAAGIIDTVNGTTTDKPCLSTTPITTNTILINFNETKSGRMRFTDLSFKIV